MRRKLAAGNWKMNGMLADLDQLDRISAACPAPAVDLLICLPATLIHPAAHRTAPYRLMIGAQDCHMDPAGAHTGDLAARQLADAGARAVILGHSERRADHHEDSATVHAKAQAAMAAGLIAVICLGETLAERRDGRLEQVLTQQLAPVADWDRTRPLVIAYEPVWAIGTGVAAEVADVAAAHRFIKDAVTLDGQARVVGVAVVKSSGNAAFDLSAEQAVRRAEQFERLRELIQQDRAAYEQNFRRFRLVFNPQDLRL